MNEMKCECMCWLKSDFLSEQDISYQQMQNELISKHTNKVQRKVLTGQTSSNPTKNMDQKKLQSKFGSNLFLMRKSESEDKSESSTKKKCQVPDSDMVFRLTMIENQNKALIQRFEDLRRQNDKIIHQNETILQILETQMKVFLEAKSQGATTTFSSSSSDKVNSSQSLAVSNPLYKYNNNTSSSQTKAMPDKKQVQQQTPGKPIPDSMKRNQTVKMGRSQPKPKISKAAAVWQVFFSPFTCFDFFVGIKQISYFRSLNPCQTRHQVCRSSFWVS